MIVVMLWPKLCTNVYFPGLSSRSTHFCNLLDGTSLSSDYSSRLFFFSSNNQTNNDVYRTCSILDMSGFENFQVNSFEQLCINVANEHLQYYFNEHIFLQEEQDYRTEGVSSDKVEFQNNEDLIELFMGVRRTREGMISEQEREKWSLDIGNICITGWRISFSQSQRWIASSKVS